MISALRFGKLPPKVDYRTLNLGNYLKDDLPEPQAAVSLVDRVYLNLEQTKIDVLFPMYANDQIGDCTVAGMAHGVTIHHGMVKQMHIPTQQNVIRIYNQLTGGIDSGLYLMDVLKFWRAVGIEESQIFAYANVNHVNHTHVKQAISIFGGLFMGFQCHEKVIEEFKNGKPWQPGRLINAGHAVYATGYDDKFVEMLTWGDVQRGSWAWWDKCVDECFALLPPEAVLPDFTPGFDFARLKKDLAEVAII